MRLKEKLEQIRRLDRYVTIIVVAGEKQMTFSGKLGEINEDYFVIRETPESWDWPSEETLITYECTTACVCVHPEGFIPPEEKKDSKRREIKR